ncbi:MAG TPA: TIGR03667 family PPOX class F420-dependent oxidoreductase [Ktedonobacterales bacterium]|nr:TIGR03667 family PPOX class F420-dependent oxidoreductase [Ktedonobacterales bacterium]
MSNALPDPTSPFGERVARRLRDEHVIWLTTIGADGTPQPNPVWFLWDGDSMLVYNKTGAKRLANIQRDPHVSLNFESGADGNDVIILSGEARLSPDEIAPEKNTAYVAKYHDSIEGSFQTPEKFASLYHIPLRVTIEKVRGF